MSVMTESARAILAKGIKEQSMYVAWGTGEENWGDTPPSEDINATTLTNEIGRKVLWRALYVLPDDEGEVLLPEGRYKISEQPTRHLYCEALFDFTDGAGATIREIGVFVGGKLKEGLPPGQSYYLPDDVVEQGTLFLLQHRPPLLRSASERYNAGFVITM